MRHRNGVFTALLLLLATGSVYLRTGAFGFVNLDDPLFVTGNPVVLRGLTGDGVRWALGTFSGGNWHPLTWLSHMADVEVFGVSAGAHHLVNVAFHACNVLLLYSLLFAMTGSSGRSGFVAAVFAVHPLHVESVAWIAERKDVLSTCLALLSARVWIGHLRKPGGSRHLASFLLYALSLMAKPMPVTLPLLLLLLDHWPLGRMPRGEAGAGPRFGSLLREKVPFLLLAAAAGVVTVVAQASAGALSSLERLPVGVRVAQALQGYVWYLGKGFWPSGLAVLYPHPGAMPPLGTTALAAGVLILATLAAVRVRRTMPYVATGWLWYLATLLPVIGLVQVGAQWVADRYSYLPLVGVSVLVAWGGWSVASAIPRARAVLAAAAAGLLLALAVSAARQAEVWRDSERLLERAVAVTRGNWVALTNLGMAYELSGRSTAAVAAYRRAVTIGPKNAIPYVNLGVLLGASGDDEAALELFRQATGIQPTDHVAWLNLAVGLNRLQRHAEAVQAFRKAVALKPDYAEAYGKLGATLVRVGAIDEAVSVQRILAGLDPPAAARLGEAIRSVRERRLAP